MKNFLYNKSDILVALLIVAAAAFLIWSRIDNIMDYPSNVGAADARTTERPISEQNDPDPNAETGEDNEDETGQSETDADGTGANGTDANGTDAASNSGDSSAQQQTTVQFVVEIGQTTSTIADNLLAANLIQSKDEFLTTVRNMGAESRLKAGVFNIQTNAPITDIVTILTA
jgi:hypothetical protein